MQNCSVAPTGLPVISPAGTNGKTPPNDFTSFFQANFKDSHNFSFRFRSDYMLALHIQNLSNCCRLNYEPVNFTRFFCILNFIFGGNGFLTSGPTVGAPWCTTCLRYPHPRWAARRPCSYTTRPSSCTWDWTARTAQGRCGRRWGRRPWCRSQRSRCGLARLLNRK